MGSRFVISCMLAMLLAVCTATAQDTSKQQKKKDKLEQEIALINRQLKDNEKRSKSAQKDLNLVRRKVSARRELVKESQKEIDDIESRIALKQHSIDSLQSVLESMHGHYNDLVRNAYKLRKSQVWYTYILASGSLPQASRRYAYMKKISGQMREQASVMINVKNRLSGERDELDGLKEEAGKVKSRRESELKELQKDERQSAAVVNKLKKDKQTYQKELAQKKKQVEALNREIQKLIAAAVKKSSSKGSEAGKQKSGNRAVTTEYDTKLAGEFEANMGKLPWPVNGSVVDHFGQHYHPVYTSVKLPFNNGVTIAVEPGSKVKAVFNGVVQQIVVMPGYNQCVLVQHGNYYTFYCKLKSVTVKSGDKVGIGQVLGTVDTIAGETQVHFQLWKDTAPQNPENWLR